MKTIKILIVDDSATETQLLKHIFESESDMEIVGYARNGKDAIYLANKLKPNLITMDIQMPVMDGIEAIRHIMAQNPTPVVVISSQLNSDSANISFKALEVGALSVLAKPTHTTSSGFEQSRRRIVDAVRSLAEIKVVKRRFLTKRNKIQLSESPPPETIPNKFIRNYELLAIGVSVGGPQVLKLILSKLPVDFPIPIVIVQHMTKGFMSDFTRWLNEYTKVMVKEAVNLEVLNPGTVYFAPDGRHLEVDKVREQLVARLVEAKPMAGFCPSVDALLFSAAKTCGEETIGMLLTGMGNDGVQGLLALKQAQAHTLIQDEESSIVFGMAGAALALGGVDKVVRLENIADYLLNLTKHLRVPSL